MKTLKKGAEGIEVEILQKLLTYRGIELDADGKFGPGTEKAVIKFQSNNFDDKGHSLDPDGIVGFATWRSLVESDLAEKPTIPKPSSDPITLDRIQTIHPDLRQELSEIYQEILERGVSIRFAQVYRTFAQQEALYAKGRTAPGNKVTNARAGQSYHNYGLAVDIVLLSPGGKVSWDMKLDVDGDGMSDWSEVVHVFKSYGWSWGGDWRSFKDYPHFEKSFGLSVRALKTRYDAGDFVEGEYVRLS